MRPQAAAGLWYAPHKCNNATSEMLAMMPVAALPDISR